MHDIIRMFMDVPWTSIYLGKDVSESSFGRLWFTGYQRVFLVLRHYAHTNCTLPRPFERYNRSILQVLTKAVCPSGSQASREDWEQHITQVVYHINTSPHSATRRAPFQVLCGYDPVRPRELSILSASGLSLITEEKSTEEIRKKARELLQASQTRLEENANAKRKPADVAIGDMVLLKSYVRKGKFTTPYEGPYYVRNTV
uniref:Putative secreted protein n=1 Tax=Argas monolakensis TaxID=34602 RepID=Q09JE9_ARGMO|nr:putative secreted protein [Argas monolakensis]